MKAELTINVRPVRHVYFIDEDDLERFVEVAHYCCTQWGGINNLIIPIKGSKKTHDIPVQVHPYLHDMMKRRHPDSFVDAVSDHEGNGPTRNALKAHLASTHPGKPLEQWNTFIETDNALHPLNIISPQDKISKPELAVAGFFPRFSPPLSELDDAILVAAFGRIWPGQEKEYQEMYILHRWTAIQPGHALYQQLPIDPYGPIINLTLKDLHNIGTENPPLSLHFDVVIAKNVWDLCWFWNLRAQSFGHRWLLDRRVLLLSKEQLLQEQHVYIKPLFHLLRERRFHPHIVSNIDVVFHHYHDEEIHQFLQKCDELQQYEGSLQVNIHSQRKDIGLEAAKSSDTAGSGSTTLRPIIYKEDSVADFSVYHEYGGSRPTFSQELAADIETFLVPSAGPQTAGFRDVYIGLQSDFWNQFPCHPSVASLIIPDSSFDLVLDTIQLRYKLTLPPKGLERVTINIPKTWDIYQAYFRSKGFDVSPSDKKPYADGLIEAAGGLEHEKAQILRSPIAYAILDFLTDKTTTKLAREIIQKLGLQTSSEEDLQQIITNLGLLPQIQRIPRAINDIFSHIRGKSGLSGIEKQSCLQVLAKLVGIKAVQRGMYIKCPHCGTKSWYGIHILDEQVKCNGCLELFDLPLTENENDGLERPFQYSLNPLANQAMNQDVLPVITALLTLKACHQAMYHVVKGMNFQRSGNANRGGDFDFIYTYRHELYGGECKSGGKFTIRDLDTARTAQSLGFRAFFFATTKPIEEDAQRLINNYQQELTDKRDNEHPFDVFILDDQVMFGEVPLPKHIPQ